MRLLSLEVTNYRNIASARLEPGRELTVICGNNGQGKTNLLEAIWLLTGGKSFRGGKDAELVRRGETFAVLEAVTQRTRQEDQEPDDPARVRITVGTPDAPRPGRYASVNGAAPKRAAGLAGSFPAVVFDPGHLSLVKGDFDLTRDSGTLYANTECGIFGKLSAEDAAKITGAALPIAKKDEIKTGRAAILATVSGNETREYDIEIEKIYSPSGSTRNLMLRVTDEELLAQSGGVVQGMSGSAILQDGKIIGAVTHVLLDDPSRGYGIFIENMLSAAGLSSE